MGMLHRAVAPWLLVSMLLASSLTLAREAQLPASAAGPAPALPASGARGDTLFLFAASGPGSFGSPGTDARGFTFDHAGTPAPAGWVGLDLTADLDTWWHVASTAICAGTGTDMSQAAPFDSGDTANDYALWCGAEDPSCTGEFPNWCHVPGYGTDWQQMALVDLGAHSVQDSLRVSFAYRCDFEGDNFDWFELRVEAGGSWVTVLRNEIEGDQTYREVALTVPAATLGGPGATTRLNFYFESDGGWSDQDCSYTSDVGAVWVDNIRASVDGVEVFATDFESGGAPPALSFANPPGAGDFTALRDDLYQTDPAHQNDSHCWTFFDPALANEDYPQGVIPYGPPYVQMGILSPWLEVDQHGQPFELLEGDQVIVRYQFYRDLPLNAVVIATSPRIAARFNGCTSRLFSGDTAYYGSPAAWYDWGLDYTLRFNAMAYEAGWEPGSGPLGFRIRLEVVDMCGVWCNVYGDGYPHTAGPYFDDIQVMVLRDTGTAAEGTPVATRLLGAHPNPFNPSTTIRFALSEAGARPLDGARPIGSQGGHVPGRPDCRRRAVRRLGRSRRRGPAPGQRRLPAALRGGGGERRGQARASQIGRTSNAESGRPGGSAGPFLVYGNWSWLRGGAILEGLLRRLERPGCGWQGS